LLGLYLGYGCLSKHRRDVYALRIACDDVYPRLIDETVETVLAVEALAVLVPRHGPGPKHRRKIEPGAWQ
jgi:hypothetical protein